MLKKFFTIILLFIVITLMLGIVLFGIYIYNEFSQNDSEHITYKIGNTIKEEINENSNSNTNSNSTIDFSSILPNEKYEEKNVINLDEESSINTFFYQQLNENQKVIYEGLKNNKLFLKQGNYVIEFKDKFSATLQLENGSDILGDDYQAAIEAFIYDNPDLFYLDIKKMYLNMESQTKLFRTTYNVYISPASDSNYLLEEFQSKEQIDIAISQIEQIKKQIINSLKGTDYQNILYIHDYLINNIEYDTTYEKIGSHSIYGALIKKECVCEGYAKAFKYLANCAGYESELITGKATTSNGETENHLWNCIKLNNNWYEIDPTWDDPIVIGGNGRATNEMKYKYFLKGANTFRKDHFLEYQFTQNGREFSYPEISQSDY